MIADFDYLKTIKQKLYLIIVRYWVRTNTIITLLLYTNIHKLQYNLVDNTDYSTTYLIN